MTELKNIAKKILEKGKGILAADESTGTMTKRLESVGVSSSPENRLLFRETLFSSSAMKSFIGGVILYDETIKQKSLTNKKIPELISSNGAIPGIKVDTGAKILANSPDEKITEGLDGLRERLKEYYKLGARFTKWRAVYSISENYPSKLSIYSNAHALARYSALVQECGMVPIVEPEVLMDGNHSAEEIAKKTLECLKKNVPADVPGIAFLSGGQSEIESSKNLNEINKINDTNFLITFSYGRGLQASALKEFGKNQENLENIQKAFNHRAKMNGLSSRGEWSEDLEKGSAA